MFRKATAIVLVLLLGLYLPAAATSACLCLEPVDQPGLESCCDQKPTCCGDSAANDKSCCEDSTCCVVIPALPDGMEPLLTFAPLPVSLPAPAILACPLAAPPTPALAYEAVYPEASPPPPGAPSRIAFGVWRL